MTARKPQRTEDAVKVMADAEREIPASQPAETEKDVVGEAKPVERQSAENIAALLADGYFDGQTAGAAVDGNRLTVTVQGPNGLVQTFHATVTEGIREF